MTAPATQLSDDALAGLHHALNGDALLELLNGRLPECADGLRLLEARVGDVQYTPGSHAQVLWKLRGHDAATGRSGRQLICVTALHPSEAEPVRPDHLVTRYDQRRHRQGLQRETPLRTAWLYVPELHLVAHAFPLDPSLPHLLDVTDPLRMRELLQQAWQPRRVRVRRVGTDTLSYTPGSRAALRLDVLAEHKDTGMPELRRLVGKLHGSRTPARLFAGHWAIWRGTDGRGVVPPAGYVSQARLSLQEFVDGARVSDLAGTGAFLGLVRRAAHTIARVHSLTLPVLARRGVEKEMAVVDRWIGILSQLRPQHAARLARIGDRIRSELAGRMRVCGTVHADFHMANMISNGQGITIIDWDQAAHGDPMVDVGRVLASLRVSSLRVTGRIDGFADVESGFLESYLTRTGEDERRARLFEAASLLIAAAGPFRLQREGWAEGAELMLDEVERTLQLSLHGGPISAIPAAKRRIPFQEREQWATDRSYVQALLVPIVHERWGDDIEITECTTRVVARRADLLHVRWALKGYRGRERWRATAEGIGYEGHSGRGPLERVRLANDALAQGHPGALQLTTVLGHLEPLSVFVFAPAAGQPLRRLLGTPHEDAVMDRLGESLARFHSLQAAIGRPHSLLRALGRVHRRARRLTRQGAARANHASELLASLQPRLIAAGDRKALTLRNCRLADLHIGEHTCGVAVVEDIALAEPLLMAGSLIAELYIHSFEHGVRPTAASRLTTAYAATSADSHSLIDAFTALALVERACAGMETGDDAAVASCLDMAARL